MNDKIGMVTNDSLAKIFSFLNKQELLKVSQVCSYWNEVSKDPSLWKELNVTFEPDDMGMFTKFCNFISDAPYVQNLRLSTNEGIKIVSNSEEHKAFNKMIQNCNRLRCLSLSKNFIIESPFLSATIKHLTISSLEEQEIIAFVKQANQLEYLNLSSYPKFLGDQIFLPLEEKHKDSLKGLYIPCQDKKSLCMLGNFPNLRELALLCCHELDATSITNLTKLRYLERLYIQNAVNFNEDFSKALLNHEFPALKCLAVESCDVVTNKLFDLICKKMPNLESFSISETYSSVEEITGFLKSCATLKCIAINIICEDIATVTELLQGILKIHQHRKFKSVCFCSMKQIRENIELDKVHSNKELQKLFQSFSCLCNKWCIEDVSSNDCFCFPNSRILCYH